MPFKSKSQQRFMFSQKPHLAKDFSKKTKSFSKLPEKADDTALFKEDIPKMKHFGPNKEFSEGQGDTLIGRLSARMAGRDMIDELNLGPKGSSSKAKMAQVADMSTTEKNSDAWIEDIPSKIMVGPGLHEQIHDVKAKNFSDPLSDNKSRKGNNMAEQAKNAGNIFNTMKGKIQIADNSDIDTIKLNIPLLLRLFEYVMEEKNFSDADLHILLEKMIKESKKKETLTMQDYIRIINDHKK